MSVPIDAALSVLWWSFAALGGAGLAAFVVLGVAPLRRGWATNDEANLLVSVAATAVVALLLFWAMSSVIEARA